MGRDFDFRRNRPHQILAALVVLAGVSALVAVANGGEMALILAPAHVFVVWAVTREIDPDHQWTALAAGAFAGGWIVLGQPEIAALAIGALILATRLVSHTTGRRPLVVDLVFVAIAATAAAHTLEGWIAGFACAIAIHLDDRFRGEAHRAHLIAALLSATGATVVAYLFDVFPDSVPTQASLTLAAAVFLALVLILRDPHPPSSTVDAKHAARIDADRLHSSRTLVAVTVVVMALALGGEAWGLVPLMVMMALVILSRELAAED